MSFRENDDWVIPPVSPKPFGLSHSDPTPSAVTVSCLPMIPPQWDLLGVAPCYRPTRERWDSPEEHYCLDTSKREQKRGLTEAGIDPCSNLAIGNRARTDFISRDDAFPPELTNSCAGKRENLLAEFFLALISAGWDDGGGYTEALDKISTD